MVSYPLLESVARTVAPVLVVCPDTLELYGYAKAVVDEKASLRAPPGWPFLFAGSFRRGGGSRVVPRSLS